MHLPAFPHFCATQALWGWLMVVWLAAPLNSAQAQAPIKILFVGNSYVNGYFDPVLNYNIANVIDENAGLPVSSPRHEFPSDAAGPWAGVPGIFKKFTNQARLNYEVHLETINSVPLHYHYDNSLTVIQRAGWDQVVLQELSTQPLPLVRGGQPADFATYVARLEQAIHSVGASPRARVYLFETWARADLTYPANQPYSGQPIDSMAQHLHYAYFRIAAKSPRLTGVAPVGDAWLRAIRTGVATRSPYAPTASRLNLWATDNSHASVWGSYLAACVLFGRLTSLDPRTLGAAEQAAAALGITPSGATALQSIAFEELNASTNPLPVTLTNFSARRLPAGVQLRWATANELRNNRFEVQRSTDGVSFGMVAGLPGHGTTTQPNYYQAFDAQAPSRLLYYRLGQFDTDGRATFSPVVAVAADATAMASFPNPTHEFIVLAAPATAYRLRNQLGQLLRHGLLPAGTGTIGLQGLPKGVYQLELRTATGWLRHRIMKE